MTKKIEAGIYIVPGRKVWPHEMHVAEVLALAGYYVEFLEETSLPTPDIKLNGVEYEIKSPEAFNANTLEHTLKNALKQSPNLIIDTSRMKKARDSKVLNFLISQKQKQKQIKRLIMITKQGQILDISTFI